MPILAPETAPLATSAADLASLVVRYHTREPGLAATLPAVARTLKNETALSELVALFDETTLAAPGLGADLALHLDYLLGTLDVAGLRRWILTGMRLYASHPGKLAAYFRLEDSAAAECMAAEAHGTSFARARHALQLYLSGFGHQDLELNARSQRALNAPALRPAISDAGLLMPDHYLAWDGALRGDIYRAAASHALAHWRYSSPHKPAGKRKPLLLSMLGLIEDARVEHLMAQDYPGLQALWGRFHVASGAAGELTFASLAARLARALHDPAYEDPNHWVNKGRDLFAAIKTDLRDPAACIEVGSILANDLGQMRVRFNPQQYVVQPAYRDDHSFLWQFDSDPPDTPPEESLAQNSVRMEATDALADQAMHVSPVPFDEALRWHYPEWDERAQQLRDRWTIVIDASDKDKAARHGAAHCRAPRSVSLDTRARLLDRAIRLRRQHEGEELDLNAAIESRISQRARMAPDPRIFQRPGRRRRHASILLLLDLSESTNDRVTGFTSLLDLEKRAAALVAQSVDADYDRLAIDGFCSDGREKVHYVRMKDFDEAFGPAQQQALMQQQGALSTRMGAALRHAGTRLDAETTEKKILLLVTDGEPSDIDVTDTAYLIDDARHAIAGLAAKGVTTFCLTLDPRADGYVKTIFGAGHYLIVDKPVTLPLQLGQALARMAAR